MQTRLSLFSPVLLRRRMIFRWDGLPLIWFLLLGLTTTTYAQKKLWDKTFGGSSDDRLIALQQTSDGGYILGGYSDSGISGNKTETSKGSYDYWIVKLKADGAKDWDKTLGGNG